MVKKNEIEKEKKNVLKNYKINSFYLQVIENSRFKIYIYTHIFIKILVLCYLKY